MSNQSGPAISALGDVTRREIFQILSGGPLSVGELAQKLPVTRSAVSQHLRVLTENGLVTHRNVGTRNYYQLDPHGIESLRKYLDQLWNRALRDFKAFAEKTTTNTKETKE